VTVTSYQTADDPLKNTAPAQHHLEEAKQFGKVVLQILG
jgi:hypothetical protein